MRAGSNPQLGNNASGGRSTHPSLKMVWQCTMQAETKAPTWPAGLVLMASLIVVFINVPYARNAFV